MPTVKESKKQEKIITFKVSAALHKEIESLAQSEGRTKSNWIKWTIQKAIQNKK